jgi:serine phosphatase RsbU (regulator of sigma subunit)
MRLPGKYRPSATALAYVLALFVAGATFAGAPAAASAAISVELGHAIGVHVETPLHVELPKVEVPGVATVETSTPANIESPSVKVEVSTPTATPEAPAVTTPVATVPTSSTPVTSPSSKTTASASVGTSTGQTAAAATPAESGSGNVTSASSTPTDPRNTPVSTPKTSSDTRRASRSDASPRSARGGAPARTHGATPASAGLTPGSANVLRSAAPARRTTRERPTEHEASSGNPLSAFGRQLPFPKAVPDWSRPIILLLALLALALGARSQRAARRARRLERQRAALLGDLDAMQATLVPAIPARLGALAVSVAYRPADGPAAGGDFYDLFVIAPGKVAIVLGDVVGHGRAALDQAALTRYTLRAYLQAGLEPRVALALASSVLTQPGEMRFATVVAAVHDGASGKLTYACAGHPPPIAIDCAAPEPLTVCNSAPLCCEMPTGRRQTTISLPSDGRVCFFSDGLPEARVDDDLLGRERLAELADEPATRTDAAALLARVRNVSQATPDDMCACILTPAVGAPISAGGAVEELEVDHEALAGARVARFLEACRIDRSDVSSALARAEAIVDSDGAALMRVARPSAGRATVSVGPSAPAPVWIAPAGAPPEERAQLIALSGPR